MKAKWGERGSAALDACSIIDPDFDDFDSIQFCEKVGHDGLVELHPDLWGATDGHWAVSDTKITAAQYSCGHELLTMSYEEPITPSKPQQSKSQRPVPWHEPPIVRWTAGTDFDDAAYFDSQVDGLQEAKLTVAMFPHSSSWIVGEAASDLCFWGREDAKRRGIDETEWLWRRSRGLAGFRGSPADSVAEMHAAGW